MLSNRLKTCLSYVKGNYLADIGCDHGYVAINAILSGISKSVYASDVNIGPLSKAKENIKKYNLEDKIIVDLNDGIKGIPNDVTDILIAGMGGILIKKILSEGLTLGKRLILQPNCDSKEVREWLLNNNKLIIDEKIVYENDIYYEIIVAIDGKMALTDLEIEYGPINIKRKEKNFLEKQNKNLNTLLKIDLDKVSDKEKILSKIEKI